MRVRYWVVLGMIVGLSLGFSWLEQGGKKDSINTQQDSPASNLPHTDSVVATDKISENLKNLSTEDVESKEEAEGQGESHPVSSSSRRRKSRGYSSLSNVQSAVRSAQFASSGIIKQVNSLKHNIGASRLGEISKLQKQINNIIQVNEQFKSLQAIQVKQIEMMTAQASEYKMTKKELEEESNESSDLAQKDIAELLKQAELRQKRKK